MKIMLTIQPVARRDLPQGALRILPVGDPVSIREVADLVFDRSPDEMWAQGATVVALWELYESPWSTTGPASTPKL